jgi:UDP-N-acetyl-D-glucosamine dehydrogenase
MKQKLIEKLKDRSAVIGILGLGYVGLPLSIRFSEVGFRVIGIDIDKSKVDLLNEGRSFIQHIPSESIKKSINKGFQATTDFSNVSDADALIICVPTPLNKYREPDLSYVIETTDSISPYLRNGQVISLESTTYPGTTEEEILPRIKSTGLIIGEDIFLIYSPEREDPGNTNFTTNLIPKVVGGQTSACLEIGSVLYEQAIDNVVQVSSTKTAEMTKLLENIHRAVNIGLVNEMKIVADLMGIDIYEVIRAAATKPFGFKAYFPGPGLGGHCIPIDPFYLTWKAREFDIHTRFIELAGEVNSSMPKWVLGKVMSALNQQRKSLNGAKVLLLGVAYKRDIDDTRESPALVLLKELQEGGAHVDYTDPHIPVLRQAGEYTAKLKSINLTANIISNYDLLLLATDHSIFDYDLIQKNAKLIVDTRGVYKKQLRNVVKA